MQQQSLWEQEKPEVKHELLEVHYEGGKRRWLCYANPADWNPESTEAIRQEYGPDIYAAFVYRVNTNPCPVCTGPQPHWLK